MKKMFKSSLLNSIMLVVLGFLLIFESEATIVSISYIIGAIIIVLGVVAGLKYVKNINNNSRNEWDIVYGIVSVVLGVVIIKNPHAIASIIPFIVGIIIIINSAAKLQYSIEMKNNENSLWKTTMIMMIVVRSTELKIRCHGINIGIKSRKLSWRMELRGLEIIIFGAVRT